MRSRFHHIIFFVLISVAGNSQSFNGTISPSVNVQNVMSVTVVQNIASINFSTFDQFNNGITVSNYTTLQIKSNADWTFSASTTTQYFSASGGSASPTMPASILQMAKSTSATYYTLSTTPQQITSGIRGDLTQPTNIFNVNLKATPGYEYGPGTYSITIRYTVTAL